ncbi:MAG: hypothetical protein B1H04_00670 [Planctomycetales bacterium 4484_123]|nr:MAG: hypothetical protein B1H04_00670 [Planctomycetales bacterium 4484_123]
MAADLPAFGFSRKARRTVTQPINYLLQVALGREDVISFAVGLVDQESLPAAEVKDLAEGLLSDEQVGRASLQYGSTEGLSELRRAIAEHAAALDGLKPEQLGIGPHNVVVSSGSQQLLYIITDVLVDPGDIVIAEWPGYFVYTGVLASTGAEVRCVEMDEDGMRIDALAAALEDIRRAGQLHRVKVVYTCDYCQNPTGITLSRARREQMLDVVRAYSTEHRICIIEDAAYRELSVDSPPPPSIKSFDRDNAQVVLAQTFSKPFAPGLRSGYAVLPDDLIGPVLDQKAVHDFGSSNFAQHLLLRAMRTGAYAEHVELLRRRYRAKRDAMLSALAGELGDFEPTATRWTRPGGGLYVWLTLPEWMDTGKDGALFAQALREGVVYLPGEFCYGPDRQRRIPTNHMRLTFGTVCEPAIREGIARLARAIRKTADEAGPPRSAPARQDAER